MSSFKNKFGQILFALCSLAAFSIQSCDKNDDPPPPTNTLTKLISDRPELSLFKAALIRTKLTAFTDGSGPFTILAPNNAALNAIGINSEADINAIDSNLLVNLLTYHILSTARPVIDLPIGPAAPITNQFGGTVYAAKNVNGTFLNNAKLVVEDIMASNGVLHIINKVLLPPSSSTVLALLTANPNFKLMAQAITKGAVTANFTSTGITVFAPTNAAFVAAGLDSTAIANSTPATLANILKYHIYNGRLFSVNLLTGALKTVQGTNLSLQMSGGAKIKGTNNPAPFNIVEFDVVGSNGIIHTIDGVLKP